MEEDVPQTLQRVVQDVIVPDLRELKVHFAANHEIEMSKIAVLSAKIDLLSANMNMQYQAIMSAISESKAQRELALCKAITPLAERVASLESEMRRAG